MTVNELGELLKNIEISATEKMKFAHFSWSKAPSGDYGVYAEYLGNELHTEGTVAEQAIEGAIDYFTRDDSATPKTKIQTALINAGVNFKLDSIQYEEDTGYIHYTWIFYING